MSRYVIMDVTGRFLAKPYERVRYTKDIHKAELFTSSKHAKTLLTKGDTLASVRIDLDREMHTKQ
jgi:hypothetical protein